MITETDVKRLDYELSKASDGGHIDEWVKSTLDKMNDDLHSKYSGQPISLTTAYKILADYRKAFKL